MKINVRKTKRKSSFLEKIAEIKLLKKTPCCWVSCWHFSPQEKLNSLPGLGETQVIVRGKWRVPALFHLAVTVVLPSPVTVRHLDGVLQLLKKDLDCAALQLHAWVFRVPEGMDSVIIPQDWVTDYAAPLTSGGLKSTNVHGISGELTLLADFTGTFVRVGK